MRRRPESEDPFVWLPCLRCGQLSVPVPTMFLRTDGSASTWNCRARPCESEHYLSVDRKDGAFVIAYRRYTLRYPLEFYDEGVAPFDVRLFLREPGDSYHEEDGYSEPVVIYPRKKMILKRRGQINLGGVAAATPPLQPSLAIESTWRTWMAHRSCDSAHRWRRRYGA